MRDVRLWCAIAAGAAVIAGWLVLSQPFADAQDIVSIFRGDATQPQQVHSQTEVL
jgi:hypothetical protein